MEKHQHFDLQLHTDSELADRLGKTLKSRKTVHEWPLSCVQVLEFDDGERRVYKSQARRPSIEDRFYEQAKSSLLPAFEVLLCSETLLVMVFEYIELPQLKTLHLEERAFVELGCSILDEVQSIKGNPPVYTDLNSKAKWFECFDEMFRSIEALIGEGVFSAAVSRELPKLAAIRDIEELHGFLASGSRLMHGDLNGGNIFAGKNDIRIIDWQRPRSVPPEVDLALMLVERGVDPLKYVPYTAVLVQHFLKMEWAVEAQTKWFRDGSYESWVIEGIRFLDETMAKSVNNPACSKRGNSRRY